MDVNLVYINLRSYYILTYLMAYLCIFGKLI